jgi:bacterial/archaeal transporter family protein
MTPDLAAHPQRKARFSPRAIFAKLRVKWLWCSLLTVLLWAAWAICSKIGSNQLSANAMQFFFAVGAAPVGVMLLVRRHFKLEKDALGISYGVANGLLSSVGNLALVAAYRSGGNTAVITTATSLYPMITVALAITVLRERLTRKQLLGLGFAAAAMVIFSM